MKKPVYAVLVLALTMLTVVGCSNAPKDAARAFTEHISKGQISEAKKYATLDTGKMLDMMSSMGGVPVDSTFHFIFIDQSIEGDKAVVRFREKADGDVGSVDLVKIDGKWKVNMHK